MNNQQQNVNPQWTDQDMLGDLLALEKQITTNYGTYVCEGSCEPFRQVLTSNYEQSSQDQFHVFQQMSQRGWYQTKAAPTQDVQTAMQKSNQNKSQMR